MKQGVSPLNDSDEVFKIVAGLKIHLAAPPKRLHLCSQEERRGDDSDRLPSRQSDRERMSDIRAEVMTPGRNNELIEQIVMRLSIEDAVSALSWSIAQSTLE